MTKKYNNMNGCYSNGLHVRNESRRGQIYKQVNYDNKTHHNSYGQRNRNEMSQGGESSEVYRPRHNQNENFYFRRSNYSSNNNNSSRSRQSNEIHQSQYGSQQQHSFQKQNDSKMCWRRPSPDNIQESQILNTNTTSEDQRWTSETTATRTEDFSWKVEPTGCASPTIKQIIQDENKIDVEAIKQYFHKKTMDYVALYQQQQEKKKEAGIVTDIDKVMNDLAATRSSRSPIQSLYPLIKISPLIEPTVNNNNNNFPPPAQEVINEPVPVYIAAPANLSSSMPTKYSDQVPLGKSWVANTSPKGTTPEKFSPKTASGGNPSSYIRTAYQIIAADRFFYQASPAFIPLQPAPACTNHPQMMVLMPTGTAPGSIPFIQSQPAGLYSTDPQTHPGTSPGNLISSPILPLEGEIPNSV